MAFTTIIVDDEPSGIKAIKKHLEAHPEFSVVATTNSSLETSELISLHSPDIVFLDIDMPHVSGLEVAKLTAHLDYLLVFVTAHDNYAVDAFETQAVDYLLKPVSPARFETCLDKIKSRLLATDKSKVTSERILLNDGKKQLLLPISNIKLIESIGRYQKVTYLNGRDDLEPYSTIICEKTMDSFETQLKESAFFRVHRCFIVNTDDISTIERVGRKWVVKTNSNLNVIPVSRSKINELKQALGSPKENN